MDENELEQMAEQLDEDAELGEELRFNIIPHALKYFVGGVVTMKETATTIRTKIQTMVA